MQMYSSQSTRCNADSANWQQHGNRDSKLAQKSPSSFAYAMLGYRRQNKLKHIS
jgi:hypothetical protein